MLLQLYLHFPFCKRKCFYCDFCSAAESPQTVAAYSFALAQEISRMGARFPDTRVNTVFLGGGTPSLVPPEQLRQVLKALHASFDIAPDAEFTSEANPGTLTRAWLDAAMEGGLNRLSLGVQAAQDALLRRIGRIHTFEQARQAVELARSCGVRNLNLDVMSGLPEQTEKDYLDTLTSLDALHPQHISAYSLILEEGTPLFDAVARGEVTLPDEDAVATMERAGMDWLEAAGYRRYEISNYAREGYECRHNIGYWQGAWYLGLGVAAHSMLPDARAPYLRRANGTDVPAYIRALNEGKPAPGRTERVSRDEAMFETVMLGLRMVDGVSERDFERRHGQTLTGRYGTQLDSLIADGLGEWRGMGDARRFTLTRRGLEVQNEALLRLM